MEPTKSEAVKFPLIATPSDLSDLSPAFNKSTTGSPFCPIVPMIISAPETSVIPVILILGVYGVIF